MESVNFKFKEGKTSHVELAQVLHGDSRIGDIIRSDKFQDIEIKQENGKIQVIKRKIKKKL